MSEAGPGWQPRTCPRCLMPVDTVANFCGHCGLQFDRPWAAPAPPPQPPTLSPRSGIPPPPGKDAKGRSPWHYVAVGGLVIAGILAAGVLARPSSDEMRTYSGGQLPRPTIGRVTPRPPTPAPQAAGFWAFFAPGVKTRIDGTTDCASLQVEFDNAYTGHERANAQQDLDRMRAQSGLMEYIDERMQRIGCYG